MSYVLEGKLQGYISPDCAEPCATSLVRFYRHREEEDVEALAQAKPKHTFAILDPEAVRAKEYLLIGQTRTNDAGEFSIDLSSKTIGGHRGWTGQYDGGPLEIDVRCESVPGRKPGDEPEAVQFTLTTIRPEWVQTDGNQRARWEYNLSQRFWGEVREALDAWVVCGRVLRQDSSEPLQGLRVFAFDADMVQDDALGSATTDADGRFRIDYGGEDFRKTPTRFGNYEIGGPDLYFRVEAADGTILLQEQKSRGTEPDRENAASCVVADLIVGEAGAQK